MILVPRWVAVAVVSFAIAAIVGVGVLGYRTAFDASGGAGKSQAELVLFLSIAAATCLVIALLVTSGRTRHISRELDKMIALNHFGEFSPEIAMKKLGTIGEKITLLYFRLNVLNEKRSLKISALADLVDLLALNLEVPLFVSDISGEILYISRRATERFEKSRAELLNTTIGKLFPKVNLESLVTQLDRAAGTQKMEHRELPITTVPVFNRRSELTYIVWVLAKEGILTDSSTRTKTHDRPPRVQGLLRRVFARNYQRRGSA